jgi:toxin CcdB
MDQFDVHRLRAAPGDSTASSAFVVILQHQHAHALDTVIVAPLMPRRALPALGRVRPKVDFEGREHIAAVDRLAAVERHSIGYRVGSLDAYRDDLIRAIDVLFTGF